MAKIELISAGAGSGKTYSIIKRLIDILGEPGTTVRPSGVIATTFTKKAANELTERVRTALAKNRRHDLATAMGQALVGTVNSVCGRLLTRFAFEAGLPPELEVVDEAAGAQLFVQALEESISRSDITRMNALQKRLEVDSWHACVKQVADLARANGIAPADLTVQAAKSLNDLLAFLPKATERNLDAELAVLIDRAFIDISALGDTTAVTEKCLQNARGFRRQQQFGTPSWSSWLGLAGMKPSVRSTPLWQPVLDLAALYEYHPFLREDLQTWSENVYRLAGLALQRYQELKAQRGLIDFVDQERLLLDVLDLPEVRTRIKEDLDLLIVDEFQDTSPIQLAMFLKLAELSRRSIWVGDVKQSIYGFRGCDPELMKAVIDHVKGAGHPLEILDTSYRSRPALVHLANELFAPTFADVLSRDQVVLKPKRSEPAAMSALEFWQLVDDNQDQRSRAIAAGIHELLAEGRQVVDRETGTLRALRFSDVALLSRTNDKIMKYAAAMTEAGLPVSIRQAGLIGTPEAALALACLRRLADPSDTLASAEVVALTTTQAPEEWLTRRLEYLASGGVSADWGLDAAFPIPALQRLAEVQPQLPLLSPAEALDLALWAADVDRVVRSWGPTEQRSRQRLVNIETLRGYAAQYEDVCRQNRGAATVGGLILWLIELQETEKDEQGQDPLVDAVQILTHHRAKGLEWPIVICADLDAELKNRIWQPTVLARAEGLDISAPLRDRTIRAWVYPFGLKSANIALVDRIKASRTWEEDQAIQLAESRRLLYVSMTRARDLLVLPFNQKKKTQPWLDCLEVDWLTPCEGTLTLPDGVGVSCRSRALLAPIQWPVVSAPAQFDWFSQRRARTEKLPAVILPSSAEPLEGSTIGEILRFGAPIPVHGRPAMNVVGTACHDIIAALLLGSRSVEPVGWAEKLLKRFQVETSLAAEEVVRQALALQALLVEKFGALELLPEWPVSITLNNGQKLYGWIDLLVRTREGWLIIDHKAYPGDPAGWGEYALGYSGQLAAYRQAVEQATGIPMVGQWIHLCLGGGLVQVHLSK